MQTQQDNKIQHMVHFPYQLLDPVDKESRLDCPIAVLLSFVDEYNAPSPKAALLFPVVLFNEEFRPIAVL